MSFLPDASTRVLIWGYGRHGGGSAAARFCAARGATVEILDRSSAAQLQVNPEDVQGWPWHIGDSDHPAFSRADLIVASPAIPPRAWPARHPPRISPEGLFCLAHRGPRLAVTGTKGKSTTARIAGALLQWEVAGNSYEPLLDVLARVGPEAPLVCELSSFQLWYLRDLAPRFAVALLTSLAVDHLDWHPSIAHYQASKIELFTWAEAVLAAPAVASVLPSGGQTLARIHLGLPVRCLDAAVGAEVFYDGQGILASRADLHLIGDHNAANAALAIAAALHLGCPRERIADRLAQVTALPHRLEPLGQAKGLFWRNDSIATTPESAMAAMAAIEGPLTIILGGSDKGAQFDDLAVAVVRRGAMPLVIGATGPRLVEALAQAGVKADFCGDLATAVALAVTKTPAGGTVVLSPACASFDQFSGFEHRGASFRNLVADLSLNPATIARPTVG